MLHHAPAIDVLRGIPSESIDLHFWDSPYALGRAPTPAEILAYLDGADLSVGDFMGHDWSIPSVAVYREAFRTLKPGCYLLTFAGTRTLDLLAMGARMAGFVPRDTIDNEGYCNEPLVARWLRGQGPAFQKTTLRPLWEPLLVLWKPGPLRNLNVDENRIASVHGDDAGQVRHNTAPINYEGGPGGASHTGGHPAGRFPGNVTFNCAAPADDEEGPGCEEVGTKRIDGNRWGKNGPHRRAGLGYRGGAMRATDGAVYTDADGKEEVPDVKHAPGCDVGELERQSGAVGRTGAMVSRNQNAGETPAYGEFGASVTFGHNDAGTAARFYYSSKPSTAERDRGVEAFYWRLVDEKVHPTRVQRITRDEWERLPPGERARGNIGPCVKRVSLCRHFASLYGVKGGRGFDAYCGTGSLVIAMEQAGMEASGCDVERTYLDIAEARRAAFADPAWKAPTIKGSRNGNAYRTRDFYTLPRCPEHGQPIPSGSATYSCGCAQSRVSGEEAERARAATEARKAAPTPPQLTLFAPAAAADDPT